MNTILELVTFFLKTRRTIMHLNWEHVCHWRNTQNWIKLVYFSEGIAADSFPFAMSCTTDISAFIRASTKLYLNEQKKKKKNKTQCKKGLDHKTKTIHTLWISLITTNSDVFSRLSCNLHKVVDNCEDEGKRMHTFQKYISQIKKVKSVLYVCISPF